MLRKNLVRYFLLRRHVFIYTTTVTNVRRIQRNSIFFLLSDPDGRLSFIYFVESFEVFIQSETTRNCRLKQGDMGSCSALSQNKSKF